MQADRRCTGAGAKRQSAGQFQQARACGRLSAMRDVINSNERKQLLKGWKAVFARS
jgi:hypothetical protein